MSTPADTTTYTVHAHRWKRGWELHIDGLGVTQSRTLNEAEKMARDYIALDTGTAADSFGLEIIPQVDGKLDEETRAARSAVVDADKAQRHAAAMSRDVAQKLLGFGLTGREIAVVLRISPQRVSQLIGARQRAKSVVQLEAAREQVHRVVDAAAREGSRVIEGHQRAGSSRRAREHRLRLPPPRWVV